VSEPLGASGGLWGEIMTRNIVTWLSIAMIAAASVSLASEKRPFGIEDFYRLETPSGLCLAPGGDWLVYALKRTDLARGKANTDLYRVRTDGGEPVRLTWTDDASESDPAISPDGKRLAFVAKRGKQEHEQIWMLDPTGGEARAITDLSTGVSDLVWSPDGKYIAFTSVVYPDCGADDACNKKRTETRDKGPLVAHLADDLLYRHWTAWADGKVSHILLVEVESGTVRDLTPGDREAPHFVASGPRQYDFSPDSTELAYTRDPDPRPSLAWSTNSDLWVVPVAPGDDGATQPATNLTASNPAWDGMPRYSPDGRYIAYLRQLQPGYESDLFRLALYDRAKGETRVLTPEFDDWIQDYAWLDDSSAILFTAPHEGQLPLYRVPVDGGQTRELAAFASIDEFAIAPTGQFAYVLREAVDAPREVWKLDLSGGSAPRRLTFHNRKVEDEVDLRPVESMWVEGAQGHRVQVFLVKPHGFDPAKKYPLVLNVHGGPQYMWSEKLRGDFQIYPGAGYVVAFANPHGSTGYGQEFTAQISGDWGGAVFEDLMKVADKLEQLPYVDPDRMGAMGWSYGGYMMNWFQGHTDRFRCLASMMGLFDLRTFYLTTEELWFPEWDLKGRPWDSDLYEKWSPSNAIENFRTPELVISGEIDFRVPYTQGLMAFTALRRRDVPARLIVLPNSGHWPDWYEMAAYYTAHLDWFHRWLGGDPAPWSVERFVENAVFDRETGKRTEP